MSEIRFSEIFRKVHADHPACLQDEWLSQPCRRSNGALVDRPVVWSRRNGPWRHVDLLWVGAAPGNAGGKGAGPLGAHGTRIPFGGDVAGANLEVLFGSIGITRNGTFITAALNQLPAAGGGEPTFAELSARVGAYPSSLHLLRDTMLAAQPRMIVALGNVALQALLAAARLQQPGSKLPAPGKLAKAGLRRGRASAWPRLLLPDAEFKAAWGTPALPWLLWLTHPSAQNMSPYARKETLFHTRMLAARTALRRAVRQKLGWQPPAKRAQVPDTGIYALREWRELVEPRHELLDQLWRKKGV